MFVFDILTYFELNIFLFFVDTVLTNLRAAINESRQVH